MRFLFKLFPYALLCAGLLFAARQLELMESGQGAPAVGQMDLDRHRVLRLPGASGAGPQPGAVMGGGRLTDAGAHCWRPGIRGNPNFYWKHLDAGHFWPPAGWCQA